MLNPIAKRLRGRTVGIEGQRRGDFRESIVYVAFVEKSGAAPEMLTNRADGFESFGHDECGQAPELGGSLADSLECKAQARFRGPETA